MKTKKCVSFCSQQDASTCFTPRCILTHPKTRKSYCRVPSTHKFQRTTCDVIRRKDVPPSVLMGESSESIDFGSSAYLWEFFREYTFKYVRDVYAVPGGHELLYLKEGVVSYARLMPLSVADYLVGVRFINRILHRFPCFLYTYGLFYTTIQSPLRLTRPRQLQTSLIQHGLDDTDDVPYILRQHVHGALTLADLSPQERLPLLFIVYHALSALASVFTHHDLTMKHVLVWRPHPTKYITYVYPGVSFQSPYVPKIIPVSTSLYQVKTDPTQDVRLVQEAYPELGKCSTVHQVYRKLKGMLPVTTYPSIGTVHVSKLTTTYENSI